MRTFKNYENYITEKNLNNDSEVENYRSLMSEAYDLALEMMNNIDELESSNRVEYLESIKAEKTVTHLAYSALIEARLITNSIIALTGVFNSLDRHHINEIMTVLLADNIVNAETEKENSIEEIENIIEEVATSAVFYNSRNVELMKPSKNHKSTTKNYKNNSIANLMIKVRKDGFIKIDSPFFRKCLSGSYKIQLSKK